jgi:hypothetical protein
LNQEFRTKEKIYKYFSTSDVTDWVEDLEWLVVVSGG